MSVLKKPNGTFYSEGDHRNAQTTAQIQLVEMLGRIHETMIRIEQLLTPKGKK